MSDFDKSTNRKAKEVFGRWAGYPVISASHVEQEFKDGRNFTKESLLILARALNAADLGLAGIMESEDIECRADEDCDHCVAVWSQLQITEAIAAVKARGDWPLEPITEGEER